MAKQTRLKQQSTTKAKVNSGREEKKLLFVICFSAVGGALLGILILAVFAVNLLKVEDLNLTAQSTQPQQKSAAPDQSTEEFIPEAEEANSSPLGDADLRLTVEARQALVNQTSSADPETQNREVQDTGLVALDIDPRLKGFRLPSSTWSMAFDTISGRLVVIDDQLGGLSVYNIDQILAGELARETVIETRGQATSVALKPFGKKRLFVYASKLESSINLIDADSLEFVGKVAVPDTYYVGNLYTGQSSEDPYILYKLGGRYNNLKSDYSSVSSTSRIDLRSMSVDENFNLGRRRDNRHISGQISAPAISPDGTILYTASSNEISEMCWRATPGVIDPGRWIQHVKTRYHGRPIVGPKGNHIVKGTTIHSRAIEAEPQILNYEPRAFFNKYPFVIGVRNNEIVIASSNDYQQLQSFVLPETLLPQRTKHSSREWRDNNRKERDFRERSRSCITNDAPYFKVVVDDLRRLAVVVLRDAIIFVELSNIELPLEPELTPLAAPPMFHPVGAPFHSTLSCGDADAKFELVSFTGATNPPVINGNDLNWTPTHEQVGRQRIRLRSRSGQASHEWEWPLEIYYPDISLPFPVNGICIEPKLGNLAVVWGYRFESVSRDEAKGQLTIGLVDLIEKKLLATRQMPGAIADADVSSDSIYVIASSGFYPRGPSAKPGNKLIRLDLSDLKTRATFELEGEASECRVIADRFLIAIFPDGKLQRFTLPDLKPMEHEANTSHMGSPVDYRRVRGGWLWEGVLWDEQMQLPLLLSAPVRFAGGNGRYVKPTELLVTPDNAPRRCYLHENAIYPLSKWIISFNAGSKKMSQGYPRDYDKERETVPKLQLAVKSSIPGYYRTNTNSPAISYANGRAAVRNAGRLYSVPFEHLPPAEKPVFMSSYIEPRQSEFVLHLKKSNRVEYQTVGAKEVRLELRLIPNASNPSITQTSKDGKFTFNLRDASEHLLSVAAETITGPQWSSVRRDGKAIEVLQDYFNNVSPHFRAITNRKMKGVPVVIHATVVASGDSGESEPLHHRYLAEIPLRLLKDYLQSQR